MPRRFCIETTNGVVCGAVFDGDTQRCPVHQARADARLRARRGSTTQRGYGTAHQQLRAKLLAQWKPGDPCARCGKPMTDKTRIDLGHQDGKRGYRGLEHDTCNRGNR